MNLLVFAEVAIAPATSVFVVALLITLGGLALVALSRHGGKAATAFWWVGILIAVLGLILLAFPIIAWVYKTLVDMLGLNR